MKNATFDIAAVAGTGVHIAAVAGTGMRIAAVAGRGLLSVLLRAPCPGRGGGRIAPQTLFVSPGGGLHLSPLLAKALQTVFGIDPGPAVGEHCLVDIEPIGVNDGHGAAVPVNIRLLDAHLAASQQGAQTLGGNIAKVLASLRRIDAVQPHPDLLSVGHNPDGVAIADTHYTHRRGAPGLGVGP